MLFQSQREALAQGEYIYFSGVTKMPLDGDPPFMARILGIKTETGTIRAVVTYFYEAGKKAPHIAFEKEMAPGEFERFVHSMAGGIQTADIENKLVEFNYPTTGLSSLNFNKEEMELIDLIFVSLCAKMEFEEALHKVSGIISFLDNSKVGDTNLVEQIKGMM